MPSHMTLPVILCHNFCLTWKGLDIVRGSVMIISLVMSLGPLDLRYRTEH